MKRIAIFASGEGGNAEAIVEACRSGVIDAEVAILVCDRPAAKVVERAKRLGIPAFVFEAKQYSSKEAYEGEIVRLLDEREVSLVCLAGYMRICGATLLSAYEGRIINIHPSLLPAFAGARAVEQAVEYGVKVFGVTIHYVDATLDGGQIIAQEAFVCEPTVEAVRKHLAEVEHRLYPQTIKRVIETL